MIGAEKNFYLFHSKKERANNLAMQFNQAFDRVHQRPVSRGRSKVNPFIKQVFSDTLLSCYGKDMSLLNIVNGFIVNACNEDHPKHPIQIDTLARCKKADAYNLTLDILHAVLVICTLEHPKLENISEIPVVLKNNLYQPLPYFNRQNRIMHIVMQIDSVEQEVYTFNGVMTIQAFEKENVALKSFGNLYFVKKNYLEDENFQEIILEVVACNLQDALKGKLKFNHPDPILSCFLNGCYQKILPVLTDAMEAEEVCEKLVALIQQEKEKFASCLGDLHNKILENIKVPGQRNVASQPQIP